MRVPVFTSLAVECVAEFNTPDGDAFCERIVDATARREAEDEGAGMVWSVYGIDPDGLAHCVGDFQTREAAVAIAHALAHGREVRVSAVEGEA